MQNSRASQFAPFNALNGFYEEIINTKIKTINHKFTKKEIEDKIIDTIKLLRLNNFVEITHFNELSYLKTTGYIRKITNKSIYISKSQIEIDNIIDIKIVENNNIL